MREVAKVQGGGVPRHTDPTGAMREAPNEQISITLVWYGFQALIHEIDQASAKNRS